MGSNGQMVIQVREDERPYAAIATSTARPLRVASSADFRCTPLRVTSSLFAVSLTAGVARSPTAGGRPCNALAGLQRHRQVVPFGLEEAAMQCRFERQHG